jgi:hypothetical protein
VTANEQSYFMTLPMRYVFSRAHTPSVDCHSIHPWVHWLSHQRSSAATTRAVRFPDVLPEPLDSPSSRLRLVEGDFTRVLNGEEGSYDAVVSVFFIDTALNVVDYLFVVFSFYFSLSFFA